MNSNKPLTLLSHDPTDYYTDSLSSCKMSVSDFKSQSEQSIDAYNDQCDDRNTTKNKIKVKTLCTFKTLARIVWIHLRYRIQYNVYGKHWLGNEANGIICCCFLNKSFVDGRMDETERRATKIKTFPKEAVMVRAMFKVVKNTAMLDDNSSLARFAIFVEFEPSVKLAIFRSKRWRLCD